MVPYRVELPAHIDEISRFGYQSRGFVLPALGSPTSWICTRGDLFGGGNLTGEPLFSGCLLWWLPYTGVDLED